MLKPVAARSARAVLQRELEARQLDLIRDTTLAYIHALSLQQQLKFDQESVKLAQTACEGVQERIRSGQTTIVEATRTETALSSARLDLNHTRREFAIARQRLASLLGRTNLDNATLVGDPWFALPLPITGR